MSNFEMLHIYFKNLKSIRSAESLSSVLLAVVLKDHVVEHQHAGHKEGSVFHVLNLLGEGAHEVISITKSRLDAAFSLLLETTDDFSIWILDVKYWRPVCHF